MRGGHEGEAMAAQRLPMLAQEGRACEEAEVHRGDVMAEAGQRQLARLDRTARFDAASKTPTFQPCFARCTAAASPLCPAPTITAS
jgi:hypothetical protein